MTITDRIRCDDFTQARTDDFGDFVPNALRGSKPVGGIPTFDKVNPPFPFCHLAHAPGGGLWHGTQGVAVHIDHIWRDKKFLPEISQRIVVVKFLKIFTR
jgi:hypothetical protein